MAENPEQVKEETEDSTLAPAGGSIHNQTGFPPRYQVKGLIGQGSTGMVFHAHDLQLDRDVAIKILLSEFSRDSAVQERFLREVKSLASVDHPNIVKILNSGLTEKGDSYFVMEFLSGESLAEALKKEQIISPPRFYQIFSQVLAGLAHIHALNIVHRDLKPGNIMLCQDDEANCLAKIIDFGIVRLDTNAETGARQLTRTDVTLGSPNYMSPEQCKSLAVNHLSDLYSLGCIMYECLSGKPPLQGETAVETMYRHLNEQPAKLQFAGNNKAANRLAALVYRCLNKDPGARPQSAQEIKTELDSLYRGQEANMNFLAGRASSRSRSRLLIFAKVLMIVSVFAFVGLLLSRKDSTSKSVPFAADSKSQTGSSRFAAHQSQLELKARLVQLKVEAERQISNPLNNSPTERKQRLEQLQEQLNKIIKEIKNKNDRTIKSYLFASWQLLFDIQSEINAPLSEQVACQKEALSLCPSQTRPAKWCASQLATLYLQISELDKAERYVSYLDGNLPKESRKKEPVEPLDIPEDLWKWQGDDPSIKAPYYRGEIACLRGDFGKAGQFFALAEQLELLADHIEVLVLMVHDKAGLYWKMGRQAEAIESLRVLEQDLCRLDKNRANGVNLADDCFIHIARLAADFHDANLARKTLQDGISLSKKLNHPVQEQIEMTRLLSTLSLQTKNN